MDQPPKVGIFIPTMNKADFVIRQLQYYAMVNSPHPVYIGDSSDTKDAQRIQKVVEKMQKSLPIFYHHYPFSEYNYAQCVKDLVKRVKESYVVFSGDDDFQVPATLTRCAQFLEINPEYATVHGQALTFQIFESGPYGRMKSAGGYFQGEIDKDTAVARLLQYMEHYFVLLFSVHRTQDMVYNLSMVDRLSELTFSAELFPFCLSSIQGKSKMLPNLSLVRQLHDERNKLPDIFDWITNPNWASAYQIFQDQLVEELVKKDQITPDVAREAVKQAFWTYLKKSMAVKFQQRYDGPAAIVGVKALLKKVYGVKGAWRFIQSMRVSQDSISLPSLLNPRSPYHQDFMPIFRSITLPSDAVI
ncbi:MAG: TIGR00180 family glycosyltransferase [bacterium]|nr:TIGR00180 family glycosyltransferase [bacterium]